MKDKKTTDDRVFKKQSMVKKKPLRKEETLLQNNIKVILWVLGLTALLVALFYTALWTGKSAREIISDQTNEIIDKKEHERIEALLKRHELANPPVESEYRDLTEEEIEAEIKLYEIENQ